MSASFFRTNSKIKLQYITNGTQIQTYVSNRVVEIKYATQCSQWRHYLGSLNLADKAYHSIPAKRQLTGKTWFKGPAF